MIINYVLFIGMLLTRSFSLDFGDNIEPKNLHESHHNLQMPQVGFGTAGLGNKGIRSICDALRSGFRMFDSAQAKEWYSESDLGNAIKNCWTNKDLDELLIITKIHPRSYEYDTMLRDIKNSKRLIFSNRADRAIDVILLHAPFCWWRECTEADKRRSWKSAWENLEKMKHLGHVQSIGVSNFDADLLLELLNLANMRVAVVQNWMDPFHQDRSTRRVCQERGVTYMAYSSLGTQWVYKLPNGENPVLQNPILLSIANKYGTSIPLVVQSWLVQEGVVAIPSSSNTAHIEENGRFLDEFGRPKTFLELEDMEAIRALEGSLGD